MQQRATGQPRSKTIRAWANIPFAPALFPFFYGWVVVAASMLIILSSIPGQTIGVSVFTDPLIAAAGITREQLAMAYMFGTVTSGLILPFAGKLLDRIGARILAIIAALGLAGSLIAMSYADRLIQVLPASLLKASVTGSAIFMMTAIFLLIRFFGQGNLTMAGRVAVAKWFNHRRGLATAISGVFITFGFNASPDLLNRLIAWVGWREACWILAATIGVGTSLIAWIFLRDNPEECGLTMDGFSAEKARRKDASPMHRIYREFTRREAISTLAFWAFAFGIAVHGLVITGVIFHITSLADEVGRTREFALRVFLIGGFFGIAMRFAASAVVDFTRVRLKWLLLLMACTEALGLLGAASFGSTLGYWTMAVGFGFTNGLWSVLSNVSFPRFFGRKYLGSITGLNQSLTVIASALGPYLFAVGARVTGSYRTAVLALLLLPALVILLGLLAENPQRSLAPPPLDPAA